MSRPLAPAIGDLDAADVLARAETTLTARRLAVIDQLVGDALEGPGWLDEALERALMRAGMSGRRSALVRT